MMESLGVEAFRYHKWANLQLLGVCAEFTEEQLQLTAPGTYGTIAATLGHLLGAEQRYIWRLTGDEPKFREKEGFPGVVRLQALAEESGNRMIQLAEQIQPDTELEVDFADSKQRLRAGVVLIQALHHGNDHRTHVCSVLGHNAIPYGDIDVWAYGEAIGAIVPVATA